MALLWRLLSPIVNSEITSLLSGTEESFHTYLLSAKRENLKITKICLHSSKSATSINLQENNTKNTLKAKGTISK